MWLLKKSAPSPRSHLGERVQATAPFSCRRLPFAAELIVPLSQHVGAPATPIVREGQEVVRGEPIARACGFLSVPMHAPATGVIRKIGPAPLPGGTGGEAIHLRVYPAATQEILYGARVRPETLTPKQIVHAVQDAGIVDACAEIVPAHTKLVLEEGQSIDTVIVNALGPAPLCATTQHVLSTQAAQISQGIRLALQSLGAQQGIIAVASGRSVGALALAKELPSWAEFDLRPVRVQSDSEVEERLVRALTGRKIPAGASAAAARCVVLNIQTIAQMGALLPRSQGHIENVVAVAGANVPRPGQYVTPLGTPLLFILRQAGVKAKRPQALLRYAAGPDLPAVSLDAPLTKSLTGLIVLPENAGANGKSRFS